MSKVFLVLCVLALVPAAHGQTLNLVSAPSVYPGSTGPYPEGVAVDSAGNLYVSYASYAYIVKIAPDGTTSHIGSGFSSPYGLAVDAAGNVYVGDQGNQRVVKVATDGTQSAIGTSVGSVTGLTFDSAGDLFMASYSGSDVIEVTPANVQTIVGSFSSPLGVAVDSAGDVFVSSSDGNVYEVQAGGPTTTYGSGFTNPSGLAVDPSGNLYVTDAFAGLFKVSGGATSPVDTSIGGYIRGVAFDRAHNNAYVAAFSSGKVVKEQLQSVNFGSLPVCYATIPIAECTQSMVLNFALSSDAFGNLSNATAVIQGVSNLDYRITASTCTGSQMDGQTCAMTVAFSPSAAGTRLGAVDIYGSISNDEVVRRNGKRASRPKEACAALPRPNGPRPYGGCGDPLLTTVYVSGVGLGPVAGFDAAPISTALFAFAPGSGPIGVTTDSSGNIYAAISGRGNGSAGNCSVQKFTVATQVVSTIAGGGPCGPAAGDGGLATSATFTEPVRIAVDGRGDVFIGDYQGAVIWKVDSVTGLIAVVAGTPNTLGYTADGALAAGATILSVVGLTVDASDNLYFGEQQDGLIRRVDSFTGILSTVAGDFASGPGYSGDGGPATSAQLSEVYGLAFDAAGNLYLADPPNAAVRKVTASTGIISTIAGLGPSQAGYSGDGGPAVAAELAAPLSVSLDAAGNLYIADIGTAVVRKVNASTGIITTVAGLPEVHAYAGDGGAASRASFIEPLDSAVDSSGNLYIADPAANNIRAIATATGIVNFGNVNINQISTSYDVAVTNNGNANLDVSALSGPTPSVFDKAGVDTSCSASATLASGANCVLGLRFLPVALGALTGSLTLTDNVNTDPTSQQTIALAGTGVDMAAKLALSGVASNLAPGGNLGTVTVNVEDSSGVVIAGAEVAITLTITGPGSYSQVLNGTSSNGVVTFNLSEFPLATAGAYTVIASSSELTSATASVTVGAASATKLATSGLPSTLVSGGNLGTATASIEDTNGTVVTGSSAVVTETITGPNGYSQLLTATAVNGVATFNFSALPLTTAGVYTVTTTSPGLTLSTTTVTVTAGVATQLTAGTTPSTVATGGNLGVIPVTLKDANGNVLTSSSAVVTATITGPGGYSQAVFITAVNGVATLNMSGLAFTTAGTYTLTISSPGLTSLISTFTVVAAAPPQDFTLNFTTGTSNSSSQTVLPGASSSYPFSLAPLTGSFTGVITMSATGLPSNATWSFSPATVTPGSTSAASMLTIQTAKTSAAFQHEGTGTGLGAVALGLLLLPLAGSRRLRQAARQISGGGLKMALVVGLGLLSLGAAAGLMGCGAGGLFGQTAQTYTVTVTGTSGALTHSTTVTLTVQ